MDFLKFQNKVRMWGDRLYTRLIRSSFASFGEGAKVLRPFKCGSAADISIGEKVVICGGGWIDCFHSYVGVQFNPRLTIGDGTYIGHRSHIMVIGDMSIGKDVMLADGVYISDNLHGYEDVNTRVQSQPLKYGKVTIGDRVWLGENVCVLPGVTIGENSVIGSNSVVTKSIPPFSVAVGSPAKVIRSFNKETGQWESCKAKAEN
jgi:acetyltransferase-like isoleucine patch superfamily enzyme